MFIGKTGKKMNTALVRVAPVTCSFFYKYAMPPASGCPGVLQKV